MATEEQATRTKESIAAESQTEAHGTLEQAIRLRAYEISQSADAGTPEENWERATREFGPAL
jgi:hypothetical protein